jgi:FKBP-type peptidyl-prolyl cis-trans isomerase
VSTRSPSPLARGGGSDLGIENKNKEVPEARFNMKRELSSVLSAVAGVVALAAAVVCGGQEPASATPGAAANIKQIELTFRRDPRVIDPTRSPQVWVAAPYQGATAQDTVEVRAQGVDARGAPTKISPQWIASDTAMVTVSPGQGDDVTIKVHHAGDSKVKITHQGLSKELEIKAQKINKFIVFQIVELQTAQPKPANTAVAPPPHKTKNDVSYAAGMTLAKALQEQSLQVDSSLVIQGFNDALGGHKTLMTEMEALAALEGVEVDQRIVEDGITRKGVAEKNKREGEAFLAANKTREGVVTLPSGLQYKILKAGEGKKPTTNDVVTVRYRGTFVDGKVFENTFERQLPVDLPVKAMIKGWGEAVQLMPEGSTWQLFVPAELAYGEHGAGGGGGGKRAGGPRPQVVGPNATLVFELVLLAVNPSTPPATVAHASASERVPNNEALIESLRKALTAERAEGTKESPQ